MFVNVSSEGQLANNKRYELPDGWSTTWIIWKPEKKGEIPRGQVYDYPTKPESVGFSWLQLSFAPPLSYTSAMYFCNTIKVLKQTCPKYSVEVCMHAHCRTVKHRPPLSVNIILFAMWQSAWDEKGQVCSSLIVTNDRSSGAKIPLVSTTKQWSIFHYNVNTVDKLSWFTSAFPGGVKSLRVLLHIV